MQSAFYPTVAEKYGVPLDTRHLYTKTDWEMWAAAVAEPETRDMFHRKIVAWINETPTYRAFTDLYETKNGSYPWLQFTARPVMGGSFAMLVLPRLSDMKQGKIPSMVVNPGT